MPKEAVIKPRKRSEEEILDQATQQLLKATKQMAKKRGKRLDRETLRQDGYSDRFIDKVENA